jgi:hypothetical protein
MTLAYTSSCPTQFEPPGFRSAIKHGIVPGDWEILWRKTCHHVSKFDASHHSVTIGARNSTLGCQTVSQAEDTYLSKQLQDLQKTSSGRHPGIVSTLISSTPRSALPLANKQSAAPIGKASPPARKKKLPRNKIGSGRPLRERQKSSVVLGVTKKNPLKGIEVQAIRRRRRDIIPEKFCEAIVQAYCLDFEAQDGRTCFNAEKLSKGIIERIEASETVRCECGDSSATELMVYCHLCNSHQHSVCYGLNVFKRARSHPRQHLCYSCLLLPGDQDLLRRMTGVVRMRLALIYLSGLEAATIDLDEPFCLGVFGTHDVDATEKADLVQHLIREGVLSKPDQGLASLVDIDQEHLSRLQVEYLDPLAGISHLYRVEQDGDREDVIAHELRDKLAAYSRDQDYAMGQGVEDVVVMNAFGQPVIRWGYYASAMKRRTTMGAEDKPSPRRRKISISAAFIQLDRSTPTSVFSCDSGDSRMENADFGASRLIDDSAASDASDFC